jgi:hypothetical protein
MFLAGNYHHFGSVMEWQVGFLGVRCSARIALRMTRAPINLALDPQMTAYFPALGRKTGAAIVSILTLESCQNPEIWKVYDIESQVGWGLQNIRPVRHL